MTPQNVKYFAKHDATKREIFSKKTSTPSQHFAKELSEFFRKTHIRNAKYFASPDPRAWSGRGSDRATQRKSKGESIKEHSE